MNDSQYCSLLNLCIQNKQEISGTMNIKNTSEGMIVSEIKLDDNSMVSSSNNKHITFNTKEYLTKMVYEIMYSDVNIYVRFHTHPGKMSACKLSLTDLKNLKANQEMALRVSKLKSRENIIVSECIITKDEVAFYYYDVISGLIKRVPLYVDGKEKIPISEKVEGKSLFQIIKGGIKEGFSEARKR